jgi:hypothetical protein
MYVRRVSANMGVACCVCVCCVLKSTECVGVVGLAIVPSPSLFSHPGGRVRGPFLHNFLMRQLPAHR